MGGKGKGNFVAPQKVKGQFDAPVRKKENGGSHFCDPIPLGNQTAGTHARTHSTTRNCFPVGLTPKLPEPPIHNALGNASGVNR